MTIEKRQQVKTYIVKLYCEDCDIEMEYTGVRLLVYPPRYKNICPQCGFVENTKTQYPATEYEYD